ncbi:hypothetical protein SEUCBS139899_009593 [Sporothrix eucalyptigena]
MSCSMEVDDDVDLALMIDTLGELKRQDVLQNSPIIRNIVAWSSSAGPRKEYYVGEGAMPPHVLKEIQKKLRTGYWMCKFAFYGAENVVLERFAATKELVNKRAPKARLRGDLHVGIGDAGVEAASIPAAQGGGGMAGVPDMWTLRVADFRAADNPNGVGGHCDFSPILPARGRDVVDWYKAAKEIITSEGFDSYVGAVLYDRSFVMIHMLLYDKDIPENREKLDRLFVKLFAEAKKRGLSKYRSHLNHMDAVADTYDFNDHAYRRFVEGLKSAKGVSQLKIAVPSKLLEPLMANCFSLLGCVRYHLYVGKQILELKSLAVNPQNLFHPLVRFKIGIAHLKRMAPWNLAGITW